jgi:hypothetical protein
MRHRHRRCCLALPACSPQTRISGEASHDRDWAEGAGVTQEVLHAKYRRLRFLPSTGDGGASAAVPLVNIVQVLSAADAAPDTPKLSVNSGGNAGDGFAADGYFDGGQTYYPGSIVVNTAGVLYAATAAIYLDQRQSITSNPGDGFAYTLSGFVPGRSYTVRLLFTEAELWQGPNQRKFNVDINGKRVLTELDVWAAAHGGYTAYAPYFETVADASGNIVIRFINGSLGAAMVSGIEVFEPNNVVATGVTDVQGNYALVTYGAGEYTVVQQPPDGWNQSAPNYTNPVFTPSSVQLSHPDGSPIQLPARDR